jgi:hypothetical protein
LPADFNTTKLLLALQVSGCLTVLLVDRDGVSFFAVQHFDFVDGPSFLPGCGNAVFDNDLNITFLISSKITRLVVVEFLPFEVGNMRVATKCANWTPADRFAWFPGFAWANTDSAESVAVEAHSAPHPFAGSAVAYCILDVASSAPVF